VAKRTKSVVGATVAPAQMPTVVQLGKLILSVDAINTILFKTDSETGQVLTGANGRPIERALNLVVAYRLIAAGKAISTPVAAFDEARKRAIEKANQKMNDKRAEMGLAASSQPTPAQLAELDELMGEVNIGLNEEVRDLEAQEVSLDGIKTIRLSTLDADGIRLGGLQLDALMGWLVVDDE